MVTVTDLFSLLIYLFFPKKYLPKQPTVFGKEKGRHRIVLPTSTQIVRNLSLGQSGPREFER